MSNRAEGNNEKLESRALHAQNAAERAASACNRLHHKLHTNSFNMQVGISEYKKNMEKTINAAKPFFGMRPKMRGVNPSSEMQLHFLTNAICICDSLSPFVLVSKIDVFRVGRELGK